MKPWLAFPLALALTALIYGIVKAFDWFSNYRYERARRIRNEQMRKYGLVHWKNSKDGFLQ